MEKSRHLVDPQLAPLLEMPAIELNAQTLERVRADPRFAVPDMPLPFPLSDAYAPVPGAPDVRLLVMNPPSDAKGRGAILHIHGGGMVSGTADFAKLTKPQLALQHDCVVVSVDYRLAPEAPFPAPQEDCYAALQWLANNADKLGIDPCRHVAGKHQVRVINVEQLLGSGQGRAGVGQIGDIPRFALLFPVVHALAKHPHTIYVFEQVDRAADPSLVGIVLCHWLLAGIGTVYNRAYQRPGPGA